MFVGAFANCARYVAAGSERPRRRIPASARSRSFVSRVWLRTLPCPEMSLSSSPPDLIGEARTYVRWGQSLPNPAFRGMSDLPPFATELRTSRIGGFVLIGGIVPSPRRHAGSRMHTLFVTDVSAFLSYRTFHQQHQGHQHQRHHGQHHKDIEIGK